MSRVHPGAADQPVSTPKSADVETVEQVLTRIIPEGHYDGEWPKGSWWIEEAGDLWPAHPILFRLKADGPSMGQDGQLRDKPDSPSPTCSRGV